MWTWSVVWPLKYHAVEPGLFDHKPVIISYPDGRFVTFVTTDDVHFVPQGAFRDITETLTRNADGTFDLVTKNNTRFHFIFFHPGTGHGETFLLSSIEDHNGNKMAWHYSPDFRITSITDAGGRSLQVNMEPIRLVGRGSLDVQIHSIADWSGQVWRWGNYIHDYWLGSAPGTFTNPNGETWTYSWAPAEGLSGVKGPPSLETFPHLVGVTDPKGRRVFSVEYAHDFGNGKPRVVNQTLPDGTVETYTYQYVNSIEQPPPPGSPPNILLCRIARSKNGVPQGTSTYSFNRFSGSLVRYVDTHGRRDAAGNLLSRTDPKNRTWRYTWDSKKNMTSETDPDGYTWLYEYGDQGGGCCSDGLLTKATSPLGQVTLYERECGNLVGIVEPTGRRTAFTVDAFGQTTAITNTLGKTWSIGYDPYGHIVSTTNPLGKTTHFEVDAVGRTTAVTDPMGHTTRRTFDAGGRLLLVADALGRTTSFNWDSTSNLTAVTDALGRTSNFQYNEIDQVLAAVNAAAGTTRFSYDGRNDLARVNNARGVDAMAFVNDLSLFSSVGVQLGRLFQPDGSGGVSDRILVSRSGWYAQGQPLSSVASAN